MCEEPPILAITPSVALADRDSRSVMLSPSGECIETERTEKERKNESIPRKFV
jgi:hypothetical protein